MIEVEEKADIETITFNIKKELKKRFQIKLIQENYSMTEKLNDFIRDYVG